MGGSENKTKLMGCQRSFFMKKVFLVLVLTAIIATGTVFADHPDGWGIGFVGGGGGGFIGNTAVGESYGLSLKVPGVPVYWGINPIFRSGIIHLGVTGDYYFIDDVLVSDIGLHWYVGVGGFASLTLGDPLGMTFGARVPVGISWQLGLAGPVEAIEVFLQVAPSLGAMILPKFDIYGGWNAELGFRVWF